MLLSDGTSIPCPQLDTVPRVVHDITEAETKRWSRNSWWRGCRGAVARHTMMQRSLLHRTSSTTTHPSTEECSQQQQQVQSMSRQRRKLQRRSSLARARSLLLLAGYGTLLMALTYRNLLETMTAMQRVVPAEETPHERFLREASSGPVVDHEKHNKNNRTLRYLSIGTTQHLLSPSSQHTTLDPTISMEWVAACTQSMVGDDAIYDVITIAVDDVWTDARSILTRRLWKRFPVATLVVLPPLVLIPNNSSRISYSEWRRRTQQEQHDISAEELVQAMAQATGDRGYWTTTPAPDVPKLDEDPRLHVLRWESHRLRTVDDLERYRQHTQGAVERLARTDRRTIRPTTPIVIGDWGAGDECHGIHNDDISTLALTGGQRITWGRHAAIAFRRQQSTGVLNTLTIRNPFPTERLLFLTYLTDADSMLYSKTRISVNGRATCSVVPYHDDTENATILPRTTTIGALPPWQPSVLQFDPTTATQSFVLIGVSLVAPEAMQGLEFAATTTL